LNGLHLPYSPSSEEGLRIWSGGTRTTGADDPKGPRGTRWLRRVAAAYSSGTGGFGGIAVALAIIGVLAFLVETQSPSFQLWTGRAVTGVELGNTVNYGFQGIEYTFQATGRTQNAPPQKVTVYLDPGAPQVAALDRVSTRIFDASFVLTPFVAAALVALVGWRRVLRIRRRTQASTFGYGFTPGDLPKPDRRHSRSP
jgi:hypothetical protein